ncbi:transformation/transcription domain-associated protein [Octopus bimaculoides]|uniref:transformation/transcription domain-associated protein n=1 Tax=Octopus bimaculoides TaxID=37653 RepID=UPI0022E91E88|nr:transformation/transcription domain-associated protein [Octopus bimaculoides]
MMLAPSMNPHDAAAQMTTVKSYIALIADPTPAIVEKKLKAAQELSENFESIVISPQYPQFLQDALRVFLKILDEGEPHFVAEQNMQQLRKLLLEIIHRIPCNEYLKRYIPQILPLMFKLLKVENEENVLVCLRIIMELHRQYRPQMNEEIQGFLQFVKKIYANLPNYLHKIFEPRQQIKVKDITEVNVDVYLQEIFTVTTIMTDKKNADNQSVSYNIIPRAVLSLKVLAELPIIVVLMYQIYKPSVDYDVSELIPLIMNTITLQPQAQLRNNPAFNKEVFVDFIGAQIKTLSFLAYIIKSYQDQVSQNSQQLVQGLLGLFTLCPPEVAHLRKELLIAARHILTTDLRNKFVPCIEKMFQENVVIGSGWTAQESHRPLAYSTLADLIHHVRQNLPLNDLSLAVNVFAKNVHDESLPSSIQTMSCKLLLNLVECIRTKSDQESGNGRELFMRMLEVFVLKFKTITKIQLPQILQKCRQSQLNAEKCAADSNAKPDVKTPEITTVDVKPILLEIKEKEEKTARFGVSATPYTTYSVADCRSLVKTLVCGVKTITWGLIACKGGPDLNKQFLPKEILVFIRLVRYALQALDIYTVNLSSTGQAMVRPAVGQSVRTKEEKEVLEHFAGVFTMMNPQTFKEIFSITIEYMVDRIHNNYALQIIANSFLANNTTSATFATILVEFLLARMEEMGSSNTERSNLYLKLFKLVFGSVSLFAAENEQMLKPHLHTIVNRSMSLAMTAKEPYNYFLLLRTLFRSIGGGSHDMLYQEFLPLLPNLLQGLNSLQSGLHKQHIKDLFVELCLTVPVRLSSLLPYLPMLMDPLVSALNGSQTLVSQGLRTLELCVDNLQPEFLYEHIQPVRAELMQALWRTLRNPSDSIALVAFRLLGKFGGGNRKMVREPQQLNYNEKETVGPCVVLQFQDCKIPINLPVEKAIDTALSNLKCSTTNAFVLRQSWELIRCFLVSAMSLDDSRQSLQHLFSHNRSVYLVHRSISLYKNPDANLRKVHEQALTGMFVAAAIKELRNPVLSFMGCMVRHYTMVAISHQCGPFPVGEKQNKLQGIDTQILVDAIAAVMGHEEKELCKPGTVALMLILNTATIILGSQERACQLPFFEYLVERLCALCYDRAWYAKYGGCQAIKVLYEHMPKKWVLQHQFVFLKALLFVMLDLTGEVSSGAIDLAKNNMKNMLILCAKEIPDATNDLLAVQKQSFHDVTLELVRQVTSSNTLIREQAMNALEVLAETTGKTVTDIMEPHKEVMQDMIPPKKHLLHHQPAHVQIGLMEGSTFCTTLQPRLFTIDLLKMEHKVFFAELLNLSNAEDSALMKMACYKNISNLVPLRKSTLRALAACHYIQPSREKIFHLLYKALDSSNTELQQAAHECMRKFISGFNIDMEMVHGDMRPLLGLLGDYRNLNLNVIQRLTSLTQLFPHTFKEKLLEQLLTHLKKFMEVAISNQKSGQQRNNGQVLSQELKICAAIINIFHLVPTATQKIIEPLTRLIFQTEKALFMEAGSPFREPLLKFLLRFPGPTVELFLNDNTIIDQQWTRYLEFIVKHKDAQVIRDVIMANPMRLVTMALKNIQNAQDMQHAQDIKAEMQFQAIRLISLLVEMNETWLSDQVLAVAKLRMIWTSDSFQEKHKKIDNLDYIHWQEPALLVRCLLTYFKHHTKEIDLLFQILRCFINRYIPQFQFVKDFLDDVVAATYPVEWKRDAFFKFVDVFHLKNCPQELKAKILQYIIIPCFQHAFEHGEDEALIGGPPSPDQDNSDNVISVFINRVIDPENPFGTSDAVRILLLQFSSLLVEQASPHIHDAANKKQGNKLRRLMTFAWPSLLPRNCVDPANKYHGHLLLAHIIAKFAIHKRIVLQVFHSLLKAHAVEARAVVRQALEILTPAFPGRMEDGNGMLAHWTKKIIVEEGHAVPQLVHLLQLVVRHYKVYYPVRHHLIQHMVSSLQRLGFTQNVSFFLVSSQYFESLRNQTDVNKPIDKQYCDSVVNFLLRIACQVTESTTALATQGEALSRRCINLLKTVMNKDVWPNIELKLAWFDKLLMTVENQSGITNICTALELLTFLLGIMKKDNILASFKPLQRGIAACLTCPNPKVIRAVHSLLSRLMSIFPTEPTNAPVPSKYEELECLYACVSKVVYDGLNNYEKSTGNSNNILFPTLMILKAACMHNPCYIDRLIALFMKVLQKMAREHLTANNEQNPAASELLILSLDLVKNRVGVLSIEMRKSFIGNILVCLIEKTSDPKVVKAITKMVEDWVKTKTPIAINQSPSIREKAILLCKLMVHVERRFPEDVELNAQFLELVNHIYRDESLAGSELTSKLEQAFLAGLRCNQHHIRQKFVEVFDKSMRRRIFDRLLYISCSQNWEHMQGHYWIKQCIELLLAVAVPNQPIQSLSPMSLLPSICSVINMADSQERAAFSTILKMKEETVDMDVVDGNKDEEEIDMALNSVPSEESIPKDHAYKHTLMSIHISVYTCVYFQTTTFLNALSQLCHNSTSLAHSIWMDLFPRIWKILSEKQQQVLAGELAPFSASGSHVVQKDCQPSAMHTFLESLSLCVPPIPIRPVVLRYMGRTHNLWHRACLVLEQMASENGPTTTAVLKNRPASEYEFETVTNPHQETLDALCDLYSLLHEDDMWTGLWQKRCKYPDTAVAIAYEQHGFFEQAQLVYESVSFLSFSVSKRKFHAHMPVCVFVCVCVYTISSRKSCVEINCPKELAWKMNLYKGYITICHPDEHTGNFMNTIEKMVEVASNLAIKEWRRLPRIVSNVHVPLLQAAQQIMELQEAAQINQGLQPANINRSSSLHDLKAIVKTWRNRLPMISDNMSHWSDIFTWRQHHYQFIITNHDTHTQQEQHSNHSMLGVHHSALAIIHFGKIARKHNLTSVCIDSLNRIHTIPTVPIVDCFQKIRQQIKCYLQMASTMSRSELQELCLQGLDIIEITNLKYFTKEMTAELYVLKGMFLAQLNRSDDANKAFSAAVQMSDTLVKAWAQWGDYLDAVFTRDKQIQQGVWAITCYLHACRHQNESRSRKYLAKVLWLLTYDDEKATLTEAVDKYSNGVPAVQWLPWIPQLLTCLVRSEGRLILNLLTQVGRMYPQAVYFPIRTLYLTLKIEQRERYKTNEAANATTASRSSSSSPLVTMTPNVANAAAIGGTNSAASTPLSQVTSPNTPRTPATPDSDFISSGQQQASMVWFRENWYEEVLRQLHQGLAKCNAVAFENRGAVAETTITPHTLNFVKKLVSTFGVGIENVSNAVQTFSSAASESLAKRAQATARDPVFQKVKSQFSTDFDFSVPGSTKLHNLINKMKKWIKILEAKTRTLPKSFLIEEKCRFLSNFSINNVEVELPGEFLLPKSGHYYVRIARFMPRVEIVKKHNTAARRLYIRGHNGKIYPYLVINDGCLTESCREERVLQLLRMLNLFLTKQKETSRRLLYFTVPRVVSFSPQMRLVEDNPASISLQDIFKQRCLKRGIEHDAPIARYYERLATVQARGSQASHQVLRDILKDVQTNMVPRGLLKEWVLHTFPDATDYWTFRKTITIQLALMAFAEFILHLTRMNPDMMYLHQDCGFLNIAYFKFDLDDQSGELDANRPVPFRLTPNIAEFLTSTGVTGPLTASMVSAARCFVHPQYKVPSFLRAILRDEYITWHKKKQEETNPCTQPPAMEGELLISLVNKAVSAITTRLNNLATFEGAESKVSTLVAAANSHDNLCRMDPAWHPWL